MMTMRTTLACTLAVMALAGGVQAQNAPATDHSAHQAAPAGAAQDTIDGEVRRIDAEARKLTLRHGPIPAFDMPGMTMVFQVKDPTMLEGLKVGDKVTFKVDKVNGQYTVTDVRPVR